jgi:hypothetical protein
MSTRYRRGLWAVCLSLGCLGGAAAQQKAHVHGVVTLDVAVDGPTLSVQLEAPADSLLGFEHRPRTAAQKQAAAQLQQRLRDAAPWLRPNAEAACQLREGTVESALFETDAPGKAEGDGHADIDAGYRFECRQPQALATLELGLFEAFPRMQRIEVQMAGPKGQAKATLRRPDKTLRLPAR